MKDVVIKELQKRMDEIQVTHITFFEYNNINKRVAAIFIKNILSMFIYRENKNRN